MLVRSKLQREIDQNLIVQYILQGLSHNQIVERLKNDPNRSDLEPVSRTMIVRDVKRVKERWAKERTEVTDKYINQQIAQCRLVQKEAWQAWNDSRNKDGSSGDSQYLQLVLKTEERISKLLGLDRSIDQTTNNTVNVLVSDPSAVGMLANQREIVKYVSGTNNVSRAREQLIGGETEPPVVAGAGAGDSGDDDAG